MMSSGGIILETKIIQIAITTDISIYRWKKKKITAKIQCIRLERRSMKKLYCLALNYKR